MRYRPEIDGLRAVAVLAVILFHAEIALFSGGFVGVDVFFVVSGFLITSILLADLAQGRFSLLRFYERRARRILPALFVVALACLPFGWMWMTGPQFTDLSESVVSTSLFVSNIHFWLESGYFDQAVAVKPLIHTWSLAVEEQFYLLFPPLLWAVWKWSPRALPFVLAGLALLSLAAAEIVIPRAPTAAFYLAPFRLWELLAGSLLAVWSQGRERAGHPWLAALGLAMIVASVFIYDAGTPFPGLYALLPILGAVLFIAGATATQGVGRVLSLRPIVWTGLISYSLYLWHQPLFAFARIRFGELDAEMLAGLIALSFVLAALSWRFVEQPFRHKDGVSRTRIFQLSAVSTVALISIGAVGMLAVSEPDISEQARLRGGPVIERDIWLVGDSHAGHLTHGMRDITHGIVLDMSGGGCIPFRNVDRHDPRHAPRVCSDNTNAVLDRLLAEDPNVIAIMSVMGPPYISNTPFLGAGDLRIEGQVVEMIDRPELTDPAQIYETGLRRTLEELSTLERAEIIFTIDIPELGIEDGCDSREKTIGRRAADDAAEGLAELAETCQVARVLYDARVKQYRAILDRVLPDFPKISVYDPTDLFCGARSCRGTHPEYGRLYRDGDHLSKAGSLYYAHGFAAQRKELENDARLEALITLEGALLQAALRPRRGAQVEALPDGAMALSVPNRRSGVAYVALELSPDDTARALGTMMEVEITGAAAAACTIDVHYLSPDHGLTRYADIPLTTQRGSEAALFATPFGEPSSSPGELRLRIAGRGCGTITLERVSVRTRPIAR